MAAGGWLRSPGDRACAVPQTSGACGGGDSNNQVGATSCGEATLVVRSWRSTPQRCGHMAAEMKASGRCGGEEGMWEAHRNVVVECSRGLAR
jgi:hypothetical protein